MAYPYRALPDDHVSLRLAVSCWKVRRSMRQFEEQAQAMAASLAAVKQGLDALAQAFVDIERPRTETPRPRTKTKPLYARTPPPQVRQRRVDFRRR